MGEKVLTNHQVEVDLVNQEGVITLLFSDGQTFRWPMLDPELTANRVYLTLSVDAQLPNKTELARQVLKEIFQGGQ